MRKTRTLLTVALATLTLAVSTLTAHAEPIDQLAARQRAANFLRGNTTMRRMRATNPATLKPVDIRTSLYAFNIGEQDGFVIVSPDDRTAPILAYSAQGHLDPETMPANMRAWFQEYENQLAYLAAHPEVSAPIPAADGEITAKSPIDPLLTSMWNQFMPYNQSLPDYLNGARCVTGCVATAMSQIMYYHQWPDSTAVTIPEYITRAGLKIDSIPAGTRLDWENMTDIYQGDESEEQIQAISTLMLAAGASVKMEYRDNANGGSGAFLLDVPYALKTYFDYSSTTHHETRGHYTIVKWEQMIYDELKAKRPVLYQGSTSTEQGHAFVVDGYTGEGFYHINWGWGNDNSESNCLLTVLNPGNNAGAGASSSLDGYSFNQAAVLGIKPSDDADVPFAAVRLTSSIVEVTNDQIVCLFTNHTGLSDEFTYGIGYMNENRNFMPVDYRTRALDNNSSAPLGVKTTFGIGGLKNRPGTYRIVPISKLASEYDWYCDKDPDVDYVELVVTEDGVTLTRHEPVQNLAAEISVDGTHLINEPHTINVNIINSGDEFYGRFYLRATRVGQEPADTMDIGGTGFTVRKSDSEVTPFQYIDDVPETVITDTINFLVYLGSKDGELLTSQRVVFMNPDGDRPHPNTDKITLKVSHTVEPLSADGAYILGTSPRIHIKVTNPTDSNYVGMILYDLFQFHNGKLKAAEGTMDAYRLKHHSIDEFDIHYFDDKFVVGDAYKLVVYFMKDGDIEDVERPKSGKTVMPPVFMYRADGYSLADISRDTLVVPARAAAVDLRQAINTKVVRGGNPNTLYFVASGDVPEGITRNIVRDGQADTIRLDDGYNFYIPDDINSISANHVRYTRAFRRGYKAATQDGWNTMTLPFAVQKVEMQIGNQVQEIDWLRSKNGGHQDFWILEFERQNNRALVFNPAANFVANQPYLVAVPQSVNWQGPDLTKVPITFSADNVTIQAKATSATTDNIYQMNGVRYYQERDTVFVLDATGHQFELKNDTSIQAFRAYFSIRDTTKYDFNVKKLAIEIDANIDAVEAPTLAKDATLRDDAWYTTAGQRIEAPKQKGVFIRKGRKFVIK